MADECAFYVYDSWNGGYCCKLKKARGESSSVDSDWVHQYCWNHYDECPIRKKGSDSGGSDSGGCYLTTACVGARGLADDCEELTVLRNFRDAYVRRQPGGQEAIAHYYAVAPRIVEKISARRDAAQLFDALYVHVVSRCVALIKQGSYQQAYAVYAQNALDLEKEYLPGA